MKKFDITQLDQYIKLSKFTCEKHLAANLYIYGYINRKSGQPIVWDEINVHLRGLILDQQGNVIQRSFQKFYTFKNYQTKSKIHLTEGQTLKLPECKFKIYEKVDGSMAILYWVNNKPYLASQRSFESPNALKSTEILHRKYSHTFNKLDKKFSYIFEAIYPSTRVVVNYDEIEDLILLAIIDNKTGKEVPIKNLGFPIAKDFTKKYGHLKDLEELVNLNLTNLEGFVLHYENGLKLKLKFPWFSKAKAYQTNIVTHNRIVYENKQKLAELLKLPARKISNVTIWEHLKSGKPLDSILIYIPDEFYACGFELWFSNIVSDLNLKYTKIISKSKQLSQDELWDSIKPSETYVFDDLQRRDDPKHWTPMWNLLKRVDNSFL